VTLTKKTRTERVLSVSVFWGAKSKCITCVSRNGRARVAQSGKIGIRPTDSHPKGESAIRTGVQAKRRVISVKGEGHLGKTD